MSKAEGKRRWRADGLYREGQDQTAQTHQGLLLRTRRGREPINDAQRRVFVDGETAGTNASSMATGTLSPAPPIPATAISLGHGRGTRPGIGEPCHGDVYRGWRMYARIVRDSRARKWRRYCHTGVAIGSGRPGAIPTRAMVDSGRTFRTRPSHRSVSRKYVLQGYNHVLR